MSFRRQPPFFSILAISAFCAITVLPVALLFARYGSVSALSWLDERQGTLLLRSIAVAGGSALIALALGVPIAFVLARSTVYLRLPMTALAISVLFVPPYVMAGAWISLLDPAGWVNRVIAALLGPDALLSCREAPETQPDVSALKPSQSG
jgi:ABC-type Fe3+ transport system permease subunit